MQRISNNIKSTIDNEEYEINQELMTEIEKYDIEKEELHRKLSIIAREQ